MRSAPPRITVSAVARNDTAAAPPPAPLPAAFNRRQWLAGAVTAAAQVAVRRWFAADPPVPLRPLLRQALDQLATACSGVPTGNQ